MENLSFLRSAKVRYGSGFIQTYSFGEGEHTVLAFPAYPHSGLIYLNLYKNKPDSNIRFITFDIPGWVGQSQNIFKDSLFSFQQILNISERIIRHYKLDYFSVIGFSFGTAIETLLASKYLKRIKNLVYVSPMINSKMALEDENYKLLNRLYRLKLYKPLKYYTRGRFELLYKKPMYEEYQSKDFIRQYGQMILKSDSKVLMQSLHELFSCDFSGLIQKFENIPVMVINSRDENPMFKNNAKLIRRLLSNEKSLYLHGRHEDFILKPKKEVYEKVIEFLEA